MGQSESVLHLIVRLDFVEVSTYMSEIKTQVLPVTRPAFYY